jgi:hypothetical protein
LRTLLETTCDITALPGWYPLAEAVLLFDGDTAYRRLCVDSFRRWAQKWLEQSERLGHIGLDQETFSGYLWKAEALEDPDLAARLSSALPEDARAKLADRRTRLALEAQVRLPVGS